MTNTVLHLAITGLERWDLLSECTATWIQHVENWSGYTHLTTHGTAPLTNPQEDSAIFINTVRIIVQWSMSTRNKLELPRKL